MSTEYLRVEFDRSNSRRFDKHKCKSKSNFNRHNKKSRRGVKVANSLLRMSSTGSIIGNSKRMGSEIDFSNVNKSHRFMREFPAYINHAHVEVERTNKRCRRTNETQTKTLAPRRRRFHLIYFPFSNLSSFSPVYLEISRKLFAHTITWSF